MKYFKPEIFNSVKRIIRDKHPYIDEKDITRKSSFIKDLGLDSLDRMELLVEFEKQHNLGFILNTKKLESVSTIGEFADILYRHINPNTHVKTKQEVFKIINDYIKKRFFIMNATPETQLSKDLHLSYSDKMELIFWVQDEFDIVLPRTSFKNLDVLCERILKRVQKNDVTGPQKTTKMKSFVDKLKRKKFVNKMFDKINNIR